MEKGKSEKGSRDTVDRSIWIGSMKGEIKINGDIFSTGAWPSDEEMEASYREQAADPEAEAEALKWIEGTLEDFCDEPWDE